MERVVDLVRSIRPTSLEDRATSHGAALLLVRQNSLQLAQHQLAQADVPVAGVCRMILAR
jgi:hypothetical protein